MIAAVTRQPEAHSAILRFAEPELPDIVYIEQLTGALYLDRPEETDHYREVMNSLSAEAETPADSERELAETHQDDLAGGPPGQRDGGTPAR